MKRLVTILWLVTAIITPSANAVDFYLLQPVDRAKPDALCTQPGLAGLSIRISWKKLHQDGFDWLDQQIDRGERLDRLIQLRVMAGNNAPRNLADVTYFQVDRTNPNRPAGVIDAPIPWDEELVQRWQELVAELGRRYGANQRITVVHVPGFADSSEMHTSAEITRQPGYSSRRLARAWIDMSGPLVEAFPLAVVSLNVATPRQSKVAAQDHQWLLTEFARVAGDRAGYQANDLSARVTLQRPKYQLLVEQGQRGHHIGCQMVGNSVASRFGGPFATAVQVGRQLNAEWLEIYAGDVDHVDRLR